jgi:DnaA family protein
MKQLLLDIKPAPAPSLDNFIVGRNAEALASLKQAIAGGQPRFIYFWGESGSGKSHLLSACKAISMRVSSMNNQLQLVYSAGTTLAVADDVHLLDNEAQIALFNTYNQQKEIGGTLITAGLHAPTQMGLRDDLATRLAWGLVYQLHPLNDDEKASALKQHAKERGMKLPDEVTDYCLRFLRRDLPSLMAILDALDEWSLIEKKPVTVPMLRKLLQLNLDV